MNPMSQFKHSGGIVPAHGGDRTLTLIVDGRAVFMVWLL